MAAQQAISISPLLLQLADPETNPDSISSLSIAAAIALIFTGSLSPEQAACLLFALKITKLDRRPDVLAACAESMQGAAASADLDQVRKALNTRGSCAQGSYTGGLCDIVGTGGDGHNTFNVSTTASILSSALLKIAKHGNNASTSKSGSADFLTSFRPTPPVIESTTASSLAEIYTRTNYAFLYAREWHPGMKHAAAIRKQLPFRTLFNLLGPLANPVSPLLEARVVGVAHRSLGPVFARALQLSGAKKALVVCGDEGLDELSCAGESHCWYISGTRSDGKTDNALKATTAATTTEDNTGIQYFTVTPRDFGLDAHELSSVAGGKSSDENAALLARILDGERDAAELDPIIDFVLLNTAALIAVSGVCDADEDPHGQVIDERGPGGFRWREGVRRARWCISSGRARGEWEAFIKATNDLQS